MPTLAFWRQLEIKCIENTIGTYTGDIGRPIREFIRPQIVHYNLEKAPNCRRKWLESKKKQNTQSEIPEAALQEPYRMRQ